MQIERVRPLVISVSLLGIICLYGYSLTLEPVEVTTAEVGEHEGQYVQVIGTVVDISEFRDITYLTIKDDHGTLPILVNEGQLGKGGNTQVEWRVQVGDHIEITGIVGSYDGEYRISSESFDSIHSIERWDGTVYTLAGLALRPWDQECLNVNVSCRIRVPLTDSSGSAYAIIEDESNSNLSLPVYVRGIDTERGYAGGLVYVNARFEYQERSLRFCLIIDQPNHHIWMKE